MPFTRRRRIALAACAVVVAAACGRCGGKPGTKAPAASPGFASRSQKLSTIPEGYEMGEGRLSPDGSQVAWIATNGGRTFVFRNGDRMGPYDGARDLAFLGNSGLLAFVAQRNGKELAVGGGKEGQELEGIGSLLATPDGTAVYSAQRAGQWRVVAGNREVAVPGPNDPSPWVSPDGARLFYVAHDTEKGGFHLRACSLDLSGCVVGANYESIANLQADATGVRLAYLAARDGRETVVRVDAIGPGLHETPGAWYDAVGLFALSRGGEHLALLARRGEQPLLVRDGVEAPHPPAESPLDLVVSRNGHALVTAVAQGKVRAFLDGKELGEPVAGAYFPAFSPDGSATLFVADEERSTLVVNGERTTVFDKMVTPRFTADGARIVYRARQSGERFVVVADSGGKTLRESPRYTAVFDVQLSPDGKSIGYGVRKGQELWWMVEPLP